MKCSLALKPCSKALNPNPSIPTDRAKETHWCPFVVSQEVGDAMSVVLLAFACGATVAILRPVLRWGLRQLPAKKVSRTFEGFSNGWSRAGNAKSEQMIGNFRIDLNEEIDSLTNAPIVEAVLQFNAPPQSRFSKQNSRIC